MKIFGMHFSSIFCFFNLLVYIFLHFLLPPIVVIYLLGEVLASPREDRLGPSYFFISLVSGLCDDDVMMSFICSCRNKK